MKAQYKILGLVIVSMISGSVFAESIQKPSTHIDFNKMIEDNNSSKQDLQKIVSNKMEVESNQAEENADKQKVMDLVDVEIGIGQDRPVVDRRFNSVGEAVVAPEFSVKLVDDKLANR